MHTVRRATMALLSLSILLTGVPFAAAAPEITPAEITAEGFESPVFSSGITLGPTDLTSPVSTA